MDINNTTREMLKAAIGITDEDINRLGPGIRKLLARAGEMAKYKIIAEVASSKYCFLLLEPGDKYVFDGGGRLIPEETTGAICIGALNPMFPVFWLLWDRIASGLDPDGMILKSTECADTGVEHGGLGKVSFNFSILTVA